MQRTLLPLFLTLLSYSGLSSGLCILQNGTVARCHELEDVKYIKTYDLDSLKASIPISILHSGFFVNLTSLRHLDLSGGAIKQIEPGSFSQLTNLRSLNLAENHIERLELGSLDGLNHLHSLNLRKNNLRHLPPALARLKILKHLDVQGNPLQCDCATLKVRDLIAKKGVRVSKKVFCANPRNVKGTSLFKLDTAVICHFEEQDREMQNDQGYKDSLEDYGSGNSFDKEDDSMEYVIEGSTTEAPKLEDETSFPEISATTEFKTTESSREVTAATEEQELPIQTIEAVKSTTSKDDEIFFDSEEKVKLITVETTTERKKVHEDGLFYPTEGSGDEEDGSGEGSGTGVGFGEQVYKTENDDSFFEGLYHLFMGSTKPSEEPNLEEEQFIDASSTKGIEEEESLVNKSAVEKEIVTKDVGLDETVPGTTEVAIKTDIPRPTNRVELMDSELHDMTKLGNVKMGQEDADDDLAEVSSAKQSKKGMGSYVVLAALLAILATLIGFAAYKGDFCRKRRKRSDVENGTELRDMQKALLETGNSAQPKIASNGNVESAPLVDDATDHDEIKSSSNDYRVTAEIPKSPNGTSDRTEPLKPPRAVTPQNDQKIKETIGQDGNCPKDDSLSLQTNSVDPVTNSSPSFRLAEANQPPLSPGAQRVKITLQENPDSVPRTPILITRTAAGENLVKTP
ncbi:hypothetical protein QLX08_000164 [Tetragonisca angustula]|uniref:LRRCT domain-containing protein n=1 Tax=Tetragonisca angustula TaxID=166442 RepID=A0AAW1AKX8_9HYME